MIDPKLHYCECGYKFHITRWMKLRMLLSGDITYRCPHCGNLMTFRLVYHVVKIGTRQNKDRMEIWKNG